MNKHAQLGATSRDSLLKMAKKELINFEKRETAFRKKDREERAAELRLPLEESKID